MEINTTIIVFFNVLLSLFFTLCYYLYILLKKEANKKNTKQIIENKNEIEEFEKELEKFEKELENWNLFDDKEIEELI